MRMSDTIGNRVAEILSRLPKGHTRAEAFQAINEAKILDRKGKLIIPSVWYHSLCYNTNTNGKTIMQELYPDFVPTESPYPRKSLRAAEAEKKAETEEIEAIAFMKGLRDEIDRFLGSVRDEIDRHLVSRMGTEARPEVKDNAIHASIHASDRDIGRVVSDLTGRRKRA